MVVTAKQLRLNTSSILKKVQRVGSLTVTLRGKPVAKLSAAPCEETDAGRRIIPQSASGLTGKT